jgi:hypothetical protein
MVSGDPALLRRPSVGECLKERDDRQLFLISQFQIPQVLGIDIPGQFRLGPARCPCLCVMLLRAGGQNITNIVEMNDFLETLETAVMPVRLDEAGVRPLVNVAQCRDLNPGSTQSAPSGLNSLGIAYQELTGFLGKPRLS